MKASNIVGRRTSCDRRWSSSRSFHIQESQPCLKRTEKSLSVRKCTKSKVRTNNSRTRQQGAPVNAAVSILPVCLSILGAHPGTIQAHTT